MKKEQKALLRRGFSFRKRNKRVRASPEVFFLMILLKKNENKVFLPRFARQEGSALRAGLFAALIFVDLFQIYSMPGNASHLPSIRGVFLRKTANNPFEEGVIRHNLIVVPPFGRLQLLSSSVITPHQSLRSFFGVITSLKEAAASCWRILGFAKYSLAGPPCRKSFGFCEKEIVLGAI